VARPRRHLPRRRLRHRPELGPVVDRLGEKHRAVRFDARGRGKSGASADYSLPAAVGDVGRVIEATAVERPIVVGWSHGARSPPGCIAPASCCPRRCPGTKKPPLEAVDSALRSHTATGIRTPVSGLRKSSSKPFTVD